MGRVIVKKENGLFAIWSTVIDDWIMDDLTLEELKVFDFCERIQKAIDDHLFYFKNSFENRLKLAESYSYYEECRKTVHGDKIKVNDKVTFKIYSNYPMNHQCINQINNKKGIVKEIMNDKVAIVEFFDVCCKCGDTCKDTTIEIKCLEKIE